MPPVSIDSPVGNNPLLIVGLVETADDHPAFGAAGVEKFAMAEIDTHMVDNTSGVFARVKKDQVTKAQIARADRPSVSGLIDSLSGKPEIHRRVTVVDQSGAIETIGALARIAIALAVGPAQNLLQSCIRGMCIFDDRTVTLCRAAATQNKEQCQREAQHPYPGSVQSASFHRGTARRGIFIPGFQGVVRQVLVVFIAGSLP